MRNLFIILALASSPAWSAAPKAGSDEVRRLQLLKTQNLVIIDVRDPDAFAKGHIQGAKNIPAKALGSAQLPKDSRIIVYCGEDSCPLSNQATQSLLDAGYAKVQALAGGFADWLKHGYPAQAGNHFAPAPARGRLEIEQARRAIKAGTIFALDVRPAKEFAAGHLPRAHNAPLEELESQFVNIPKDQEILVYDRLASRSQKAFDKLKAAGFNPVELSGGLAGWVKNKGPLEVK